MGKSELKRSATFRVLWLAGLYGLAVAAGARAQDKPVAVLTAPAAWAEIDTDALKGRPAQLAWSDDRSELYLEVVDGESRATLKFHHYLVRKGAAPKAVDGPPRWVEAYWQWKSAKSFFGDSSLSIQIDTQQRILDNLNGTAANRTVYLSDSPNGVSGQALLMAEQTGGKQVVSRLRLHGQIIGEFVNEMIVPGYTFSWSPEELRLIAYRASSGRLAIMNDTGRTETSAVSRDVLLPAWSDDGAAIAYLERLNRKKFVLQVVEIEQRP
jgi:hypothetical protein